jgi:hypothetical protein
MAKQEWTWGLPAIKQVDQLCDGCLTGKHQRASFTEQAEYHTKRALEIVHGDLYGPIMPTTPRGKKLFLLLVDNFSQIMWSVLLHSKDEALEAIKRVRAEAEVASGKKMSCLCTDRGGEFIAANFIEYCNQTRVRRQLTVPYLSQQNDMVERHNQSVVVMARSIVKGKGHARVLLG